MTLTRWLTYIPVIVALATLYGLCQLGFWQLDRAAQKQALLERHEFRSRQSPAELSSLLARTDDMSDYNDISDYPVRAAGKFINTKHLLLDNRILHGNAGFNVLTPFEMDDTIVLVDRGWIAAGKDRAHLPAIPDAAEQHISGTSYVPNPNVFTLQDDNYAQVKWPLLVQKLEPTKLSSYFDKPLAPLVLRLTSETTPPLVRDEPIKALDPERNYGYAFQWFAMAAAVFFIAFHFLLKKIRQSHQKTTPLLQSKDVQSKVLQSKELQGEK